MQQTVWGQQAGCAQEVEVLLLACNGPALPGTREPTAGWGAGLAGKDLFPKRTAGLWRALLSWSAGRLPVERETFLLTARKAKDLWALQRAAGGNRWMFAPLAGSAMWGDTMEGCEDSLPRETAGILALKNPASADAFQLPSFLILDSHLFCSPSFLEKFGRI